MLKVNRQYQEPQDPERGALSTQFEWFEAEPPQSVWDKLDERLEEEEQEESSRRLFYRIAACLLLLGMISFTLFQFNPKAEPEPSEKEVVSLTTDEQTIPTFTEVIPKEKTEEVMEEKVMEKAETPTPQIAIIPVEKPKEKEVAIEEEMLAVIEIEEVAEIAVAEVPHKEEARKAIDLAPITETPVLSVAASSQEVQDLEVELITKPATPKRELRFKLGPLQITHKNYRQKTNTSRS